jgi:hypothetical protein
VGPICDDVRPPWRCTRETHALRCHIPLEELRERETLSRGVTDLPMPEQEPA